MALILGLESSCDDTAAALVTSDRCILAQAVVGQNEAHRPFGGVVPEIAARAHVEILPDLVRRVLGEAGKTIEEVDAIAATHVDAIKFQVHIADAESSAREPFRVQFSEVDATRFEYWKRMELSPEQWKRLKSHCDDLGVEFLATPFSNTAVDLLEQVGVQRYKWVPATRRIRCCLKESLARAKK